jgi:hypothetical protein
MPTFMSTGVIPKALAMVGSAVAMTVASRFSMKKVTATTSAISRVCRLRPDSAVVRESGVAGDFTEVVLFRGVSNRKLRDEFYHSESAQSLAPGLETFDDRLAHVQC